MKRVAIYTRVSTSDQNPEMQLKELREFAGKRGFLIFREYMDQTTGKVEKRRKDPSYRELLADAHRKRFDIVLVWKFDRFARSLGALIDALNTFSSLDIDFISCTQAVDTTTPMGKFFFHLVGAFAEFERELILERTRAGLANARSKGVILGRPRNRKIEQSVIELRHQGLSVRKIAAATGRSAAGVRKILKLRTVEAILG